MGKDGHIFPSHHCNTRLNCSSGKLLVPNIQSQVNWSCDSGMSGHNPPAFTRWQHCPNTGQASTDHMVTCMTLPHSPLPREMASRHLEKNTCGKWVIYHKCVRMCLCTYVHVFMSVLLSLPIGKKCLAVSDYLENCFVDVYWQVIESLILCKRSKELGLLLPRW